MNLAIGLLGCGTVGQGVVQLAQKRADMIRNLTGTRPVIRKVLVQNPNKKRAIEATTFTYTTRPEDILHDSDIRIVVEVMGGVEHTKDLILEALRSGKHVVTANKDLMAVHGPEILKTAEENNVEILYEASVGGAIPLIRPLKDSLTANEITGLKGIINGTTNYILTQMTQTGASFAEALKEAQDLGFAEADPTSDVDGLDAARKLTILASLAFYARVRLDEVEVQGIRSITARDVQYAAKLGTVIKLVAVGSDKSGHLSLSVRPALIPKQHPLSQVSGSFNALYVEADAAGDLMFYGRGAGSLPTASAVMGDVISLMKDIQIGVSGRSAHMYMPAKHIDVSSSTPMRHYIRLTVTDEPGVFARIASGFAQANVSMETVLQQLLEDATAEIVIVTHAVEHTALRKALQSLESLTSVQKIHNVLPVESNPV
ncbi:homoserine dehydrogenase [Alicyclobacillus sp. SO9]|uniref:homoserine dehydrogenase n=1 Tax=Alicyclobacillus sp. SO9 TaxID=2665646 RepID=UPI0018E72396|nr:homoserine dehydrogenase [Alicyclobacillus sp. SO9]QQE77669.1 homoserine dehydrogenase [Alicyclobacillus sp. SO9]